MNFGPTTRNKNQVITYWAVEGRDGYNQPKFADPVLLNGFWIAKENLLRRPSGDEVVTTYEVYLDIDVAENGYLALGSFLDTSDPRNTSDFQAYEIHSFTSTPDLRNMEQERKALL